jgi:hypothetical protein
MIYQLPEHSIEDVPPVVKLQELRKRTFSQANKEVLQTETI